MLSVLKALDTKYPCASLSYFALVNISVYLNKKYRLRSLVKISSPIQTVLKTLSKTSSIFPISYQCRLKSDIHVPDTGM